MLTKQTDQQQAGGLAPGPHCLSRSSLLATSLLLLSSGCADGQD